ncbi:nitrate reductase molybdenum cofactor assembly chaperone [Aldersonia kunmingensis]|uniref:nitrate reductase molybdenum cofactor assembly chaperone n=1 Tax=Aldersonia kunmingensis TaxID=408066 RepID=UPI00082B278A|nr:nitrate reductase molybdenum cofactor assembly chaperone [Aldersonia kunmingensis]
MRWRGKTRESQLADRLVWQAASLLLDYPGTEFDRRLDSVDAILARLPSERATDLIALSAQLRGADRYEAATRYVETFDLRRRNTLYLTYWTAGETRNRGREMLRFVEAYRIAGMTPPSGEAPDHLAVVLEFGATVDPDAGRRLLGEFAVPIRTIRSGLADAQSRYAAVLDAVCATLPAATDTEAARARRLADEGPPAEAVGLEPFTLTVPPRRTGAAERKEVG